MFFRVDEVVGGDFKCFLTAVLGFLEPVALGLRSEADVDCFVCHLVKLLGGMVYCSQSRHMTSGKELYGATPRKGLGR